MLDSQLENTLNVAETHPPVPQSFEPDEDDLTLLYPDSDSEHDDEVPLPEASPALDSSQPTRVPSEATYIFPSPFTSVVAPVAKPAPDIRPSSARAKSPLPPSRPASSQSSHSLDVPLSQTVPSHPPPRPRAPSPPPKKRPRLDAAPRTTLELLVSPPGAHPLNYDAASNTYHGSSTYYSVKNNSITILASDGSAFRRPPSNQGYEILDLDDHSNIDWRKKIGEYIGGAFFAKANQLPERPKEEPPWTLSAFPQSYALSRRTQARVPTVNNPSPVRTDIYLYGANSRFASPAEYAPHALWLMRGAVRGACACKYCSKSTQKSITAAMEDAVIAARTAPSARRIKHSATPSPMKLKPAFASPVKRTVPGIPLPTIDFLPTIAVPSPAVSNDAEFLRALKRRREDTSDIEEMAPPTPAMKLEEDELAEDNL